MAKDDNKKQGRPAGSKNGLSKDLRAYMAIDKIVSDADTKAKIFQALKDAGVI